MKKFYTLIVFSLTAAFLHAQLSPSVQWQSITWEEHDITHATQTQAQSSDEWWYSHKNVYNSSGIQTGYALAGYVGWVYTAATFTALQNEFNEGPASCCNLYTVAPNFNEPDCEEREYSGMKRSQFAGNVGIFDLNGMMVWCEEVCMGDLQEVIQDGNFIYVIGNHTGSKSFDKALTLSYNPTAANPGDNFSLATNTTLVCNTSTGTPHIYIAKMDLTGNMVWQFLYGIPDYATDKNQAMNSKSLGYDLIKNSDGLLYAVGQGQSATGSNIDAVILKIDPATGYLVAKNTLPIPILMNVHNQPLNALSGKSIVEIGTTGKMAVAVTGFFNVPDPYSERHRAFVYSIDQALNLNSAWATNPIAFASNGGNRKSNIWEVAYHKAKNEIMAGVLSDCVDCLFAGNNIATGKIFRILPNGTLSTIGTNPSVLGSVNAYDLRLGVVETRDKGFIAVSSTNSNLPFSPPTPAEMGYLFPADPNCTTPLSAGYNYWDTDPLVVKFDSTGKVKWSKAFDVTPGRARQAPPGDLKRQECMYKITQAQDGGYVLSGNCSFNFDDNYIVKLYNDTLLDVNEGKNVNAVVSVFPNPCKEIVNVSLENKTGFSKLQVELFEMGSGKLVKRMEQDKNEFSLSMEGLNEGIFVMRISGDNILALHKIVHFK